MLLIDGAEYQEWTLDSEDKLTEDNLEQMVIEHSDDIFGPDSIYVDRKYKLKTITGVGSIPDGFAIIFNNQPEWYIVEVELSSHDMYEHVVKQVTKFMDGIENLDSKDNLFEAIWNGINSSYLLKHKLEKASGSSNPHWFLSNIIKKSRPTITLIIEKEQPGLEGTLSKFSYLPHKIVEFRTFRREGAEAVHAHLFKPLYEPAKKEEQKQIVGVQIARKEPPEDVRQVTASDFTFKGNGVFALESDPSITIDVRKHHRLVEEQLTKQGLWTKNLGGFCWYLRKKVGLLKTPPED